VFACCVIQVIQFTSLHTVDDDLVGIHKSFCVEDWPSLTARRAYSLLVFAVQFCLPLLAITALYLRIFGRLRARRVARRRMDRRARSTTATPRDDRVEEITPVRGGNGGSGPASPVAGGCRARTSRLLALIVTNFVAFWLPWNVLSLVAEYDRTAVPVELFRLLDLSLVTVSSSVFPCQRIVDFVFFSAHQHYKSSTTIQYCT